MEGARPEHLPAQWPGEPAVLGWVWQWVGQGTQAALRCLLPTWALVLGAGCWEGEAGPPHLARLSGRVGGSWQGAKPRRVELSQKCSSERALSTGQEGDTPFWRQQVGKWQRGPGGRGRLSPQVGRA